MRHDAAVGICFRLGHGTDRDALDCTKARHEPGTCHVCTPFSASQDCHSKFRDERQGRQSADTPEIYSLSCRVCVPETHAYGYPTLVDWAACSRRRLVGGAAGGPELLMLLHRSRRAQKGHYNSTAPRCCTSAVCLCACTGAQVGRLCVWFAAQLVRRSIPMKHWPNLVSHAGNVMA